MAQPSNSFSEQRFIDGQIRRVRRSLKWVDLSAGLIALVIGVVVYLLAMALLEHWVVPGGWGSTARVVLFAGLLLGMGWHLWRVFLPLVRQSINPVYAAQAIEQSTPLLKNSLLNLLLLRDRRRQLSANVYQAIEQQAAQGLSKVRLESVVDRTAVLRLGYLLVAVVAFAAIYHLLSPKDPFASATRVLLPWSNLAAPSRVQILDVQPGTTSVARGEQLEISAEVVGMAPEEDGNSGDREEVRLLFSTKDGQLIDQVIPMRRSSGGLRYACRLPGKRLLGDSPGVQNDLTYRIVAGDARSERFELHVFAHPTMVVQSVRYDYPAYTGYPSREVENSGDVQAVEGTRVTVRALANQPIRTAHVDLQADGSHDLAMMLDDRQATATFGLALRADRRTPQHNSYMLRYTTTAGRTNRQPPKYQIEVLPDYAPEIQLLAPEEEVLDVMLDESVQIRLEARDPDFALGQVLVVGTVDGKPRLQQVLLSENHTGRYAGQMRFTPAELGLQAGDVLEYWAEARDNRHPEPNLAFTQHQKIRVLGPLDTDGNGQPGENRRQDQPGNQEEESGDGGNQQEQPGGIAGGGGEQSDAAEQEEGAGGAGEPAENSDPQAGEQNSGEGEGGAGDSQQENNQSGERDADGNLPGESGEPNDSNDPGDSEPGENPSGDSPSDRPQDGTGETPSKVSAEGDDDGAAFDRISEHFAEQDERGEGEDASGRKESASESAEAEEPGEGQQEEAAPEGEMQQQQGPAGGGENPGENQGAPDPQGKKQPRDKSNDAEEAPRMDDQEPPAQGEGKQESDSKGQQGGDRSGEGQEGGGQRAQEEGTGGAGTHEPANQGAGASNELGESASANARPGEGEPTNNQTGESSQNTPGQGTEQSPQAGAQPGGSQETPQAGTQPGTEDPNGNPTATNSSEPSPQEGTESDSPAASPPGAAGQPQGGGMGDSSASPPPGELAPGDEANLDYAGQQTDLMLERLDDQLRRKQVDRSLLKKLGWSPEELSRFVSRWKDLKSRAAEPGDAATGQLDAALRSLGLRKPGSKRFDANSPTDQLRNLRDDYRGKTPQRYVQPVRDYLKGVSAAREE